MRSRYTAYAIGLADYILATTDPSGPHWREARAQWLREVRDFCDATDFDGLEILETRSEEERAWVRFRARLRQDGRDASFDERSLFHRRDGRWRYHSGEPV